MKLAEWTGGRGTGKGGPQDGWGRVAVQDQSQLYESDLPDGHGFQEVVDDLDAEDNWVVEGDFRRERTKELQKGIRTPNHGAGQPSMQRGPNVIPPDRHAWAPAAAPPILRVRPYD